MNKKTNILRTVDKVMFLIIFIVLFLMYYFGSGYSFLSSVLLSIGFILICLIIRIFVLKLAKKMPKE